MFLHLGYVLMTNCFMIFFLQLFHYFGRPCTRLHFHIKKKVLRTLETGKQANPLLLSILISLRLVFYGILEDHCGLRQAF